MIAVDQAGSERHGLLKPLYFFSLAGGEVLTRQPDSPHFWHFFGLQRVSTVAPHFSQVKMAMAVLLYLSICQIRKEACNS
jgi:hypothetical protein